MSKWRLAESLVTLRDEINTRFPERSKSSDGAKGDAAHAKRKSFHNPDKHGVVCAIDITHDPDNGADMGMITDYLVAHAQAPLSHVIFNKRIASNMSGWKWVKYSGANQHIKHAHVAVAQNPMMYDLTAKWLDGYGAPAKPINTRLYVNNKEVSVLDMRLDGGKIYMPLSAMAKMLDGVNGVKASLSWNAKTKTAKMTVRSVK